LGIALRGIWGRRGVTATILAVAVVATAAATVGPLYLNAAGTSILQDTLDSSPPTGRGVDIALQAIPNANLLDQVTTNVRQVLAASPVAGDFGPPITALEFPGHLGDNAGTTTELVWRAGACGQLRLVSGRCARSSGEVVVSTGLAKSAGLRIGQRFTDGLTNAAGTPLPLTVTGVYAELDSSAQYWFSRPYFETPPGANQELPAYTDALFTAQATFAKAAPYTPGSNVVDLPLDPTKVTFGDIAALNTLNANLAAQVSSVQTVSTIGAVLTTAQASQQALTVPVFLVTAQLLVLCWLLLFLLVTDAAEARGSEVALAKLRGLTRRQTVLFGLSEQVVLLVVALPVGTLVGWLATKLLAVAVLRSGTPVPLVGLGWAAAGVAVLGGAVAALGAARRTLSRPVLAQWSHTTAGPARRGWVVDAVIATLAVAGIVELFVSGILGSASHNPVALLAPGLIALTVALLSARALPILCRATFGRTGRRGGLGAFLAVRQVARRPGGARTTIALTTAFGLVTFTVAAWSVVGANLHDVAWTEVGAAQVLTVSPPPTTDLATVVDRLDPAGHDAVAVDRFASTDPANDEVRNLIAVQPSRFAQVAYWRDDFTGSSLAALTAKLDPPAPPPINLLGDQLSVTLDATITGGASGAEVYAVVQGYQATASSPVDLGPLQVTGAGTFSGTLTGTLPNCGQYACRLRQIYLAPQATDSGNGVAPFTGSVTLRGLALHDGRGWHPVDAGFGDRGRWISAASDTIVTGDGSLTDTFTGSLGNVALNVVDLPAALPAIMTGSVLGNSADAPVQTYGLDDDVSLAVRPVAIAAALPGAGTDGLIVDLTYAQRSGNGIAGDIGQQVWLSPTAPTDFAARLRAAGVTILSTQQASTTADTYHRQGPALALVLFLADAAAAALLAAGGAVLGMHLAGRRRGYELAALVATGASKRSLGGGLLIEQGITLGFGALLGIGAGLLATVLAVPSIPEFVNLPLNGGAPLHYTPSAGALGSLVGIAVGLLVIAALGSVWTLVSSIRPDQLREAAP
jgi:ABC-type antimicrobial peptide transport system permease subunit